MREMRLRGWWWKVPLLLAVVVPVGWSAYGLAVHEPVHPRDRTAIVLPDPPSDEPTIRPPTVLEPKSSPGTPPGEAVPGEGGSGEPPTSADGGQDVFPTPDPARDDEGEYDDDYYEYEDDDEDDSDWDDDSGEDDDDRGED